MSAPQEDGAPGPTRMRHGGISGLAWGTGPFDVVYLHGALLHAHAWDQVLPRLRGPSLALDLPGHGESDWYRDGDYRLDRMAAAITEVVVGHGAPPVAVVGHSRGALVAVRVAAALGAGCRRLVLVDSDPTRPAPPEPRAIPVRAAGAFEDLVEDMHRMRGELTRDRVAAGVRRAARQRPDGTWAWRWDPAVRAVQSRAESAAGAELLRAVVCPVAVIRGTRSAAVDDGAGRRIAALTGRPVAVEELPTGHNPHTEAPALLAAAIARLLAVDAVPS